MRCVATGLMMFLFKSPGLREQGSSPEQMDSGFANSRFCNSIFVILIRALTFLFGHQFSYLYSHQSIDILCSIMLKHVF